MMPGALYRGPWPQNVSNLAKYGVRFLDGEWKIAVLYEVGEGLRYLAVEGESPDLVTRINQVKLEHGNAAGGPFYVNEYRHVIVPVRGDAAGGTGSLYYCAGRLEGEFRFEYEGRQLTTRPVDQDGRPLEPGDNWVGPRPGIPYVLSAGGGDIYYETPALTDTDPPEVLAHTTRRVKLSLLLNDRELVTRATRPIAAQRGHRGGRFYVNEHGAIFTPVQAGDGNGLEYIYCGQIDRNAWFPEPQSPKCGDN